MPQTVQMPDGATLQFPDDMPQEEMRQAILTKYQTKPAGGDESADVAEPALDYAGKISDAAAQMKEGANTAKYANRNAQLADLGAKSLDLGGAWHNLINQPARLLGQPDMESPISPENVHVARDYWGDKLSGLAPNLPVHSSAAADLLRGVGQGTDQLVSGAVSPDNALAMMAGARFPTPVATAFAGTTIGAIPESGRQLLEAKSPEEAGRAAVGLAGNIAVPAMIGKHLVKGEPVPQVGRFMEKNERVTPMQEAPAPAEAGPDATALTPHESLAKEAAAQVGQNVEFADLGNGNIARPGQKGTILLDRAELGKYLEGRSPEEAANLVSDLIDHEEIHSHTPDDVALDYHDSKTGVQQKMALRRYGGTAETRQSVSPTNLGHEMLRFDLQQLMGKTPTEILEAKGREWLTVKLLTAADRTIDAARKAFGTDASENQTRILNEMEQKVAAGRKALGVLGQPAPPAPEAPANETPSAKLAREQRQEMARQQNDAMDALRRSKATEEEISKMAPVTDDAPFAINKDASGEDVSKDSKKALFDLQQHIENLNVHLSTEESLDLGDRFKTPQEIDALKAWIAKTKESNSERARAPDLDMDEKIKLHTMNGKLSEVLEGAEKPQNKSFVVRHFAKKAQATAAAAPKATAAEALKNEPGETDYKTVVSLPPGEAKQFFEGNMKRRNTTQKDGVMAGMKLSAADVPELTRLRDETQKEWMESSQPDFAGDPDTYVADFGKVTWLNGAIEGANKKGPNYDTHLAETAKAGTPPEFANSFSPSAIRKTRKGENEPELSLPATSAGVARPSAEDLGATTEPVTPAKLSEQFDKHFAENRLPSFSGFAEDTKQKFGNIQPGQLKEGWKDAVWKRLMDAPGAELSKLRESLGLKESIGPGELPDRIESKAPGLLEGEMSGEARAALREDTVQIRDRQNRRKLAIARIGEKLVKQSETERPSLSKSSVTPDDIGWWREKEGVTAFQEFKPGKPIPPETLTSGAGVDKSGRKALPETATKRLTALKDNLTGRVDLVSTYRKSRGGEYIVDPGNLASERPHVPVNDLLQRKLSNGKPRYNPVGSLLLDEPVQRFHQRLTEEGWREFADKAQAEAQHRNEAAEEQAGLPQPEIDESKPVLRSGTALTDAEAGAIHDHLLSEVGKVTEPADISKAIDVLRDRANDGTLAARDFQVINALEKAVAEVQRRNRNLLPGEALETTFSQIYENARHADSREAFVRTALSAHSRGNDGSLRQNKGSTATDAAGSPVSATASSSARDLTMLDRRPPTVREGVNPPPGPGPEPTLGAKPGAIRKRDIKIGLGAEAARMTKVISDGIKRNGLKLDIPRNLDGLEGRGKNLGKQLGNSIKAVAKSPVENKAAQFVVSAKGDILNLDLDLADAKEGLRKGMDLERTAKGFLERRYARDWQEEAKNIIKEVLYARNNWNNRSMRQTALATKEGFDDTYEVDKKYNPSMKYSAGYIPGRWETPIWFDTAITFGNDWTLGLGRAKPKTFRNRAEAIKAGYISKVSLTSDLLEHRASQSFRQAAQGMFWDYLRDRNDPVTGDAVVTDPYYKVTPKTATEIAQATMAINRARRSFGNQLTPEQAATLQRMEDTLIRAKRGVAQVPMDSGGSPNHDYELKSLTKGGDPVAILKKFGPYIDMLTEQGGISKSPVGQAALSYVGAMKHGWQLIFDTFHGGRLSQIGAALNTDIGIGKPVTTAIPGGTITSKGWMPYLKTRPGWSRGVSVLDFREKDLDAAKDKGLINQTAVDWARSPIQVRLPGGRTGTVTTYNLAARMQSEGLNVGRIQDALYKHLVDSIPVVGALNRWTFDRMTRGVMMETAINEFKRLNEAYPDLDTAGVMRQVIKDTNVMYGNLGRQGIFKNPTMREINQLFFLAPQWVEGLIAKEVKAVVRAPVGTAKAIRNQFVSGSEKSIPYGTIGRGVAKGLMGWVAITQAINFITRGQSTFQNEEEGHKWDAWIPDLSDPHNKTKGFWLSPMSVFAEVTHDLLKYAATKETFAEAVDQFGSNKLSQFGKMLMVLATRKNEKDEKIRTTPGIVKQAVGQMVPAPLGSAAPISLSQAARAVGHAAAPGLVDPNRPGAVQKQAMASLGVKTEFMESANQSINKLARAFVIKSGGTPKDMTRDESPTYYKVRSAIQNGDTANAIRQMEALRKVSDPDKQEDRDAQIEKTMEAHILRPLTGKADTEQDFKDSLTTDQLKLYDKAQEDRQAEYEKFQELWEKRK